jgi:hypothetical protein
MSAYRLYLYRIYLYIVQVEQRQYYKDSLQCDGHREATCYWNLSQCKGIVEGGQVYSPLFIQCILEMTEGGL